MEEFIRLFPRRKERVGHYAVLELSDGHMGMFELSLSQIQEAKARHIT